MNSIWQEKDDLYIADVLGKLGLKDVSFLVSGVTGMIGSAFCRAVLQANDSHGYTNRIVALARNTEKAGEIFKHWTGSKNLELVRCDDVCAFSGTYDVDYVLHAAGNTDSSYMVSNPVETFHGIIGGASSLLKYASSVGVRKFILLSSMEVYGVFKEMTIVNEHTNLGDLDLYDVRSCYPVAKRAAENLAFSYFKEYSVPTVCLRLAQTFGVGFAPSDKRVVPMFIRCAEAGEDIVLSSTGGKVNNFCYLADAVSAILFTMCRGEPGGVYNVSDMGSTCTIKEMAEYVASDIMNGKISVHVGNSKEGARKFARETKFEMDSSLLGSLGWKATVSVREALARNIGEGVN